MQKLLFIYLVRNIRKIRKRRKLRFIYLVGNNGNNGNNGKKSEKQLKAKIQKGLKDYNGAIETSNKSLALAKEGNDEAYQKSNERLQAEIKALPDYVPAKAKKK